MALDYTTPIGLTRLLIPDTDEAAFLFLDAEITAFLGLNAANPRRAAAEALEALASNEALVSKVIRTQDLSTDGAKVAAELRARAKQLRAQADEDAGVDDGSGGFYVVDYRPHPRYPYPDLCGNGELAEPGPWC